ncbi:MAG TPA: hypothetical protein VNM92_12510 [Thermoanaerobaculia bacterium]|nr:hypothetical protein [Thermoanaerobaculia bacterium]
MKIRLGLLLFASLTSLTSCATQSRTVNSASLPPGTIQIVSSELPQILDKVPALLESLVAQQLSTLDPLVEGTIELDLRSGIDSVPNFGNTGFTADEPQQPPVTWFLVDYKVKDLSGREVSHGTLTATGPRLSTRSVKNETRAVVMGVAVNLRHALAKRNSQV